MGRKSLTHESRQATKESAKESQRLACAWCGSLGAPVGGPVSQDLPRWFGPFFLLERLAVGGMAEVFAAKTKGTEGFEKLVALKLIHPHLSEDPQLARMLIDEARITVQLTHPNIVRTFDLACVDDRYCIVMEFIDGLDAARLGKRIQARRTQLPIEAAVHIAIEVLFGLDYAHRKTLLGKPLKIIHRDISPQNILISRSGEVKVVDFGIAKTIHRTAQNTQTGVIKGKYYYMSPEQAWGDPLDSRSDIFSLGMVLHELLTGKMVHRDGPIPRLLEAVRDAQFAPPSMQRPEVPSQLDAIVMKALSKEQGQRYATASLMAAELQTFLHAFAPRFTRSELAELVMDVGEDQTSTGLPAQLRDEPTLQALDFRPEEGVSALLGISADALTESLDARPAAAELEPLEARGAANLVDDQPTGRLPRQDLGKALLQRPAPKRSLRSLPPPPVRVGDRDASHGDAAAASDAAGIHEARRVADSIAVGMPPGASNVVAEAVLEPAPAVELRGALPPLLDDDDDATYVETSPSPEHRDIVGEDSDEDEATVVDQFAMVQQLRGVGSGGADAIDLRPRSSAEPAETPPLPLQPRRVHLTASSAHVPIPTSQGDPFLAKPQVLPDRIESPRRSTAWKVAAFLVVVTFALLSVLVVMVVDRNQKAAETSVLEIVTTPPGARVVLDGQALSGETPLDIATDGLTKTKHHIEVRMPGFQTWTGDFIPEDGRVQSVVVLRPLN